MSVFCRSVTRHAVRDESGSVKIQRAKFFGITSACPVPCLPRIIVSIPDRAFPFFSQQCVPKFRLAATAGGSVHHTRGLLIMEDSKRSRNYIFISHFKFTGPYSQILLPLVFNYTSAAVTTDFLMTSIGLCVSEKTLLILSMHKDENWWGAAI